MWGCFASELEAASGQEVDYREEGTMVVALDRDDHARLEFLEHYYRDMDLDVERLSGREVLRREPYISRRVTGGLFSPLDHQVDNRKVVVALKAAALKAGVTLREDCAVLALETEAGRVKGLMTGEGFFKSDLVILASGPWARELEGIPQEILAPVRPVKGQMAAVGMPAADPILRHVVWIPDGYLIPRRDGRLIIGGTMEDVGFDWNLTAGGVMEILRNAWEALPGIYDLPLIETWVAFRPTSRDDAPIFGPSGLEGLLYALGHHRNGILLAPMTAKVLCAQILKGELPGSAKPFTMARFEAGKAHSSRAMGAK